MTSWLEKMKDAFGGAAEARAAATRALKQAHRCTVELVAELATSTDAHTASIEQVRESDFVISQPSVGGLTQPLRTGERFLFTVEGPKGRISGQTHVIGRFKTPSGGSRLFFGYRMAMPKSVVQGNIHDYLDSQRKRA